jgi:hypothetical protein
MSFEPGEQSTYNRVSEHLFEVVNSAISEAATSSLKGGQIGGATFAERLWTIRKRVLAFEMAFFAGGGYIMLGIFCVTHWNADPAWIMAVFPPGLAILLGTFPLLAYLLNRWIRQFGVTSCPACGTFLWPTTIHALQIAAIPRCPHCWTSLNGPVAEA